MLGFHLSDQGLRRMSLHLVMPWAVAMIASSDTSLNPMRCPSSTLASIFDRPSVRRGRHHTLSPNGTNTLLDLRPFNASRGVDPSGRVLKRLKRVPACSISQKRVLLSSFFEFWSFHWVLASKSDSNVLTISLRDHTARSTSPLDAGS